jgi:hypothetical protein
MFAEAFVVLPSASELLLETAFDTAGYDEVVGVESLHEACLLVVCDILRVDGGEGGLGETEQIDGIQDIGFTLRIVSVKNVGSFGEFHAQGLIISEISQL